jgi:RNA polymerase sigma-70 factor (ECF subfamily)
VGDVPSARILDPPDAELVSRARRGEGAAFAGLVDRHYPTCVRYAVRFLGHREDAEDAVQETWLRVHRSLAGYRERDVFERWLFRILLNVCRTVSGRRSRETRRFGRDATEVAELAAPAREVGAVQTIQALLARLDPRTRETLLLKYGLGLDYTEMARRTGDSVSALKMRVKRGVEALRPRMGCESEP